jgi:hypothetical protein
MTLPTAFCWTRVGVEAGQSLHSIFNRKEQEREANRGLFFWGIGNAIGPSMATLVRRCREPEAIFSPIKSAAKAIDVNPDTVAAWTRAECLDGSAFELPAQTLITSRLDASNPKSSHYALVCSSDKPLTQSTDGGTIDIGDLANLLTGRPVGASQVTAVVRRLEREGVPIRRYGIVLRARLIAPFFLRLRNPILLSREDRMQSWDSSVGDTWADALESREMSPTRAG